MHAYQYAPRPRPALLAPESQKNWHAAQLAATRTHRRPALRAHHACRKRMSIFHSSRGHSGRPATKAWNSASASTGLVSGTSCPAPSTVAKVSPPSYSVTCPATCGGGRRAQSRATQGPRRAPRRPAPQAGSRASALRGRGGRARSRAAARGASGACAAPGRPSRARCPGGGSPGRNRRCRRARAGLARPRTGRRAG